MAVKSSLHDPNRAQRMAVLDSLSGDVLHVQTLLQSHVIVNRAARVFLKCDQCHAEITHLIDETDPKRVSMPSEIVCLCGCIWPLTSEEVAAIVRQLDAVRDELAWALEIAKTKALTPPEPPAKPEVLYTNPEIVEDA